MNYENMSDDLLNAEVKHVLFGRDWINEATLRKWHFNNPTDAWPVIVENKISVTNELGQWVAMDGFKVENEIAYCNNWEVGDNPLRAAMVVFLMMQDKSE